MNSVAVASARHAVATLILATAHAGRSIAINIEQDLNRIEAQEAALQFDSFDLSTAWEVGARLRGMALERNLGVAIDVHLHAMPVFYAALPGSTPDNAQWIRRKRNLVFRLFRSSYATGLDMISQETTIQTRLGLSDVDFAPFGGSFPILVKGSGCIGAITVSGLPQRDDHNLVVEALAAMLSADHEALRLDDDD